VSSRAIIGQKRKKKKEKKKPTNPLEIWTEREKRGDELVNANVHYTIREKEEEGELFADVRN